MLGILLYPWMETSPRGRALFGAFGLVILGGALQVVRRSPWLTWLAMVLALVVVALSVVQAIAPHPGLPIAIAVALSVFYFYATGSLIAYMLQDWVATTDELFAAGATFTCWRGRSPMPTPPVRRFSLEASVRRSTRRGLAPGWSCSF